MNYPTPEPYGLMEIGDRELQEDAWRAIVNSDGSWMLAVADGLGGAARSEEAAPAAVNALPNRIETRQEMLQAFSDANAAVRALAPIDSRFPVEVDMPGVWGCEPVTTLCVMAWTPNTGLLGAWIGDSIAVLMPHSDKRIWHAPPQRIEFERRVVGEYALLPEGTSPKLAEEMVWLSDVYRSDEDGQLLKNGVTVALLSDGAYKGYADAVREISPEDVECRHEFEIGPYWLAEDEGISVSVQERQESKSAAHAIMEAAREHRLHDNTTIVALSVSSL